jgi:hypothetical protein
MNQPDTSDLHKFYTTLGVLIIALSFLVFWTISTTHDVFLIDNKTLDTITALAKENILKKQRDLSCLYDCRYPISFTMIFLGLGLFFYGIGKWKVKQENADLEALAKQTDKQTDEQKNKKLRNEIMETEGTELNPKDSEVIFNNYKDIEKKIFEVIRNKYEYYYDIRNNAIFNNVEYDIIMFPARKLNNNILNIDIKYYARNINYVSLVSGYRKFLISLNKFDDYLLDKKFKNVEYKLLWIYNNNDKQLERLKEYKKQLEDSNEYKANTKITIKIINATKIDELKLRDSGDCT